MADKRQPGRAGASIPQYCPSAVGAAQNISKDAPSEPQIHFAALCRKHFQERSAELQIPRLRSG